MDIVFQAASKAYWFVVRGPSLGKLDTGAVQSPGLFTYLQICRKTRNVLSDKGFTNEEEAIKWALRKRMALYKKQA